MSTALNYTIQLTKLGLDTVIKDEMGLLKCICSLALPLLILSEGDKCNETQITRNYEVSVVERNVTDQNACVKTRMGDPSTRSSDEPNYYYSIVNRTELVPNAVLPCAEGAAVYCPYDQFNCHTEKPCYPTQLSNCSRFVDKYDSISCQDTDDEPCWAEQEKALESFKTCLKLTSTRVEATDRSTARRCYKGVNISEEVQQHHHRNNKAFVCEVTINEDGTTTMEQAISINFPHRFDRNGYCKDTQYKPDIIVKCKDELCNDYAKINATYNGTLDDMPDCFAPPKEVKSDDEGKISDNPGNSGDTQLFPVIVVIIVVVVVVIFVILTSYGARHILRRRKLEHTTEQSEHTELLRSGATDSDIINPIDLALTQHLPDNVIALVNGNQVMLLITISNGTEFEEVGSNLTLGLAHDSCRMHFTRWTEVTNHWLDQTWTQLADQLETSQDSNQLHLEKLKRFASTVAKRRSGTVHIYKCMFEMAKPVTLASLLEQRQFIMADHVKWALMDALIDLLANGGIAQVCEKMSTNRGGPMFPCNFSVKPSTILIDAETLNKTRPTMKLLVTTHESNKVANPLDNPDVYYMVECYLTKNHFMAEKWLTCSAKHMIGLINQLTLPFNERMINERHPFFDMIKRLRAKAEPKQRELYVKWLSEDEGNHPWNSTFEQFDGDFQRQIEHLKPANVIGESGARRIMTQYSVEQNYDSKMNAYNHISGRLFMQKTPNYQTSDDEDFNHYLWGFPGIAVCDMKLSDLREFSSDYLQPRRLSIHNNNTYRSSKTDWCN